MSLFHSLVAMLMPTTSYSLPQTSETMALVTGVIPFNTPVRNLSETWITRGQHRRALKSLQHPPFSVVAQWSQVLELYCMVVRCCATAAGDCGSIEARKHMWASFPIMPIDGEYGATIALSMLGPDRQKQTSAAARGGLIAPETIPLSTNTSLL